MLSWCLARWLEFLLQFNFVIKFQLGRLDKKPDTLTRRWDIYEDDLLRGNLTRRPVFTQTQLSPSPMNSEDQPLTI